MNEFNFCDENIKKDIDIVARDLLIQEQYQEIAELADRIAELEEALNEVVMCTEDAYIYELATNVINGLNK